MPDVLKLSIEERLNFLRKDSYAPLIVKRAKEMFPTTLEGVYAQDLYRDVKDGFMVYFLTGISWDDLIAIEQSIIPDYDVVKANEMLQPFFLAWKREPVVPMLLNITDIA